MRPNEIHIAEVNESRKSGTRRNIAGTPSIARQCEMRNLFFARTKASRCESFAVVATFAFSHRASAGNKQPARAEYTRACVYTHTHAHIYIYIYIYICHTTVINYASRPDAIPSLTRPRDLDEFYESRRMKTIFMKPAQAFGNEKPIAIK